MIAPAAGRRILNQARVEHFYVSLSGAAHRNVIDIAGDAAAHRSA